MYFYTVHLFWQVSFLSQECAERIKSFSTHSLQIFTFVEYNIERSLHLSCCNLVSFFLCVCFSDIFHRIFLILFTITLILPTSFILEGFLQFPQFTAIYKSSCIFPFFLDCLVQVLSIFHDSSCISFPQIYLLSVFGFSSAY